MKFNEYELVLTNNKLSLQIKQQFNTETKYLDDVLAFIVQQYDISNSAIEKAFVLSYDNNGNLTGIMQAGLGDHRDVSFNLNSCFKFLLLNNAMGCIFIHNHPIDAEINPSSDDYQLDAIISSVCSILKIDMLANIILQGKTEYYNITKNIKEELVHEW